MPMLADSLAWLECRQFRTEECGDHYIIIGEVLDYVASEGEPLLFYRGQYGRLAR